MFKQTKGQTPMRNAFRTLIVTMALILLPFSAFAETKVELTSKNSIALVGEVNANSVGEIIQFLVTSPAKEVYIYIDSPGGSVFDGLQLAEVMDNSDKKITCVANIAASMAFYLLQSCDERLVTKSAIVMQHVPSYGLRGDEPNNYSFAKFIRRISQVMDARQAKRIGLPYGKFRALTRNDWWLFGSQSVGSKVADDIASVTCSKELAGKVVEKEFRMLFWTVKMKFSGCPLVTAPLKAEPERKGDKDSNKNEAATELTEFMKTLNPRATVMQWYITGDRKDLTRVNYFFKE